MAVHSRAASSARPQVLAPAAALDRKAFLRPIAHRGLHNKAKRLIENTATAFLAAIEKGYGIECDLRSAAGGTPMVFHDATLDRLVEASGPIAFWSAARLARVRYKKQPTSILSFAELLHLVRGRVPLLVEVKNSRPLRKKYLENIASEAGAYRGPIALMSFDRTILKTLNELAPTEPRGWVVGSHQLRTRWWVATRKRGKPAAVSALLNAAPPGLSFLAVDVKLLPAAAAWRAHGPTKLPLFSWTIRTPSERALAARWADAPIFEGYEP